MRIQYLTQLVARGRRFSEEERGASQTGGMTVDGRRMKREIGQFWGTTKTAWNSTENFDSVHICCYDNSKSRVLVKKSWKCKPV